MQNRPTDEDGSIIADPPDPIAPGAVEPMKAVGTIGTAETVGETMAEPAVAVETGIGMEAAVAVETTEAMEATEMVETAEVVVSAVMIDGGLGRGRGRHGSTGKRERDGAGRDGGLESGMGRGDERRHR